jgi:hypothetical protein
MIPDEEIRIIGRLCFCSSAVKRLHGRQGGCACVMQKLDLQRYSIKLGEQGLYLENCMRAAGYTHAAAENSYDAGSYRTKLEAPCWSFRFAAADCLFIALGLQDRLPLPIR